MDDSLEALEELIDTVRTLRGPGGCNWDRKQTLESLRPYMLEEAYEVADAVDRGDMDELRKELGDLLLHIIMSAEIARDSGDFDLAQVAGRINEKLRRRHPHVFDSTSSLTPEEVEKQWEAIKAMEKRNERRKFFDSIPDSMPALQKAWRIQQRASEVGYPWPGKTELAVKVAGALDGPIEAGSAGELLFDLTCLLRQNGIEPEQALRERNRDFIQRFDLLEELLHEKGLSLHDVNPETLAEHLERAFSEWSS